MKKDVKEAYDSVGTTSVLLNDLLDELKACQAEKEALLAWISSLDMSAKDKTTVDKIRNKMSANLERFKKVVKELERRFGGTSGICTHA